MALFEFEDGHLVPAQFGYPVAQDLGPDLVDAICQQVLQIVSRPLFPVTWRDMTGQVDEETPRLTALDVTGQIVSVEILKLLDSETLITSLSRLAVVASLSWSDLASEYPSGPEGFRSGWAQFRDSMPPAVGPGPRLIMVAGEIDPSVRPALSILATSGVEVHLMNLRQMSNGRLFLDVNAVGPRLYGHAPQLLGSASATPAITAGAAPVESETPTEAEGFDDSQTVPEPPKDGADADAQERAEDGADTPTTRPTPKVAPHLRDVFAYSVDEEPPAPWKPASEEEGAEESADEAVAAPEENAEQDDAPFGDEERKDEARAEETPTEDLAPEAEGEVEAARDEDAHDEEPVAQGEQDRADDACESDEREHHDDAEHVDGEHADGEHGGGEAPEAEGDVEAARDEDAHDEEPVAQGEQDRADDACESDEREHHDDAEHVDGEHADGEHGDHEADEPERADGEPGAEVHAEPDGDEWREHDHPEERAVYENDKMDKDEEQHVTQDETPRWERPAHLGSRASRRAQAEPAELNDGGATDAATASFVDRAEESPEVVAAREEGVPVLGRDEAGLRTLAQILGQDTPLVARGELGLPDDLVLAASGAISGAGLTYPSLDTMLTARGMGHIDAWTLVRIGDRLGPTLAEALDEVNREIVREYAHAPRERRAARH